MKKRSDSNNSHLLFNQIKLIVSIHIGYVSSVYSSTYLPTYLSTALASTYLSYYTDNISQYLNRQQMSDVLLNSRNWL